MKRLLLSVIFYITLFALLFFNPGLSKKRFSLFDSVRDTISLIENKLLDEPEDKSFCNKEKNPAKPDLPIRNWGLYNETCDSHIHVVEAWKIHKSKNPVVVAVVDTGVDFSHPALSRRKNKVNPIDYDFVQNRSTSIDFHGHGTHVAGIIGAKNILDSGIFGITKNAKIMSLRYYSDNNIGPINLANTISALRYAIDNGAQIINYSGGGRDYSEEEHTVLKIAEARGILIVAAAGNESKNTDIFRNKYYPASYHLSNIITVAATDVENRLIPESNWGKIGVDVAAPGADIYSTLPKGSYGFMTGTSQATAFVSGIAAMLLSEQPKMSPQEIKHIIESSVDKIPGLRSRIKTGGRVNAFKAISMLKDIQKTDKYRLSSRNY